MATAAAVGRAAIPPTFAMPLTPVYLPGFESRHTRFAAIRAPRNAWSSRSFSRRARERRDRAASSTVADQDREPALARLLALRADHPVDHRPLVPWRLRVEECGGLSVRAKPLLLRGRQGRGLFALEGVDAGLLRLARIERSQAGGSHPSELRQICDARHIDGAPVASRLPRREPNRVSVISKAAADAVDPSEAKRLVNGLGPGDALLAAGPLVEADDELTRCLVVLLEPRPKGCRSLEKLGQHHRTRTLTPTLSRSHFACKAFRGAERVQRSRRLILPLLYHQRITDTRFRFRSPR